MTVPVLEFDRHEHVRSSPLKPSALRIDAARTLRRGREVIAAERRALEQAEEVLDTAFVLACDAIIRSPGRLVVSGMGKSGHIARKIAATFAATGTPALFLHPGEAAHGDLGMIAAGDVLLILSNSGDTAELRPMLNYARRLGVPIIGAASSSCSMLMEMADVSILLPKVREACAANVAPTASTTMQLALGDALAMAVMDERRITREQLGLMHPGGSIGLELTRVDEIMHPATQLPLVSLTMAAVEVISAITAGRFGIVGVVSEEGALVGSITDGDLRRNFPRLHHASAADIMNAAPKTIPADTLGADALTFLNHHEITAAFIAPVGGAADRPIGIIHVHDLLRHGFG